MKNILGYISIVLLLAMLLSGCAQTVRTTTETGNIPECDVHSYPVSDDYFSLQICTVCGHIGRVPPTNERREYYESILPDCEALEQELNEKEETIRLWFDEADKTEDESRLSEIGDMVKNEISRINQMKKDISYVYLNFMEFLKRSDYSDENIRYYDDLISYYNHLTVVEYDTKKALFYSPLAKLYYSDKDIENAIEQYESEKNKSDVVDEKTMISEKLEKRISEFEKQDKIDLADLFELAELRNELAATGDYSNYRSYCMHINGIQTVRSKQNAIRNYVREYLVPAITAAEEFDKNDYFSCDEFSEAKKNADILLSRSAVNDYDLMSYITSYLHYIDEGEYSLDQFDTINTVFKNGLAFIGEAEKNPDRLAFTGQINEDKLLFLTTEEEDYGYCTCANIVHELGHMLGRNWTNNQQFLEMESQNNEVLFYAYLLNHVLKDKDVSEMFEYSYLRRIIYNIVIAVITDHYEEIMYQNSWPENEKYISGIDPDKRWDFIKDFMNYYGTDIDEELGITLCMNIGLKTMYQPCAYFKYYPGMIAQYTVFNTARNINENKAKEAYYRIVTYPDYNDVTGLETIDDVLEYANLPYINDEEVFVSMNNQLMKLIESLENKISKE